MSVSILQNAYHSKNRRKVYTAYSYYMIICVVKGKVTLSDYLVNRLLKWLFIPGFRRRPDKCDNHKISVRALQYLIDIKPHLSHPWYPYTEFSITALLLKMYFIFPDCIHLASGTCTIMS